MKLEKTVYDVVVATVADYGRMKKMLDKGSLSKNQAVEITRKLDAVDNALMTVCDGDWANSFYLRKSLHGISLEVHIINQPLLVFVQLTDCIVKTVEFLLWCFPTQVIERIMLM
jgi:hypothetical protein